MSQGWGNEEPRPWKQSPGLRTTEKGVLPREMRGRGSGWGAGRRLGGCLVRTGERQGVSALQAFVPLPPSLSGKYSETSQEYIEEPLKSPQTTSGCVRATSEGDQNIQG